MTISITKIAVGEEHQQRGKSRWYIKRIKVTTV